MSTATETLGLGFEVNDLPQLLQALKDLGAQARSTGKDVKNMLKGVQTVQAVPGQATKVPLTGQTLNIVIKMPANALRPARQTGTGAVAERKRKPGAYGPAQRHRDLERDLQDPALKADRLRYQDTLRAYQKAHRQLVGPSPQQRILTAIRSTRINLGGASPLVGRSMDALGALGVADPEIAPLGIAMLAATALAAAFYTLATKSADIANSFTQFETQTGSSIGTTAKLQTIAASVGLTDSAIGGIAQTVQDRITSDPMARAAGLSLGVYNLPGLYGNQDYGKQLTTVINNLANVTNLNTREALARQLGVTELLPLTFISRQQRAYNAPDEATRTGLMTPQLQMEAADFQAAMGRTSMAFQNLLSALGPAVLPSITNFFNALADALNNLSTFISNHMSAFKLFFDLWKDTLTPVLDITDFKSRIKDLQEDISGIGKGTDPHTKALDENTRATVDNTRAYLSNPGLYGTIKRDQTTLMPAGVNGMSLDMTRLQLSAF